MLGSLSLPPFKPQALQGRIAFCFAGGLPVFVLVLVMLFSSLQVVLVSEGPKPACVEGWVLALQPCFIRLCGQRGLLADIPRLQRSKALSAVEWRCRCRPGLAACQGSMDFSHVWL